MKAVVQQRPGQAGGLGFNQDGCQARDKPVPVRVVAEDAIAVEPVGDDVVQRPGGVYS